MRGLIIKDLYIARKTLLIYFGAMVLNSLFFVIVGTFLFINEDLNGMVNNTSLIIAFLCLIVRNNLQGRLIGIDERRKWGYFGVSTPVATRGIVAAKYAVVFLLSFVGFVFCFIMDIIFSFVTGVYINNSIIYMGILFLDIIWFAIELPFVIRYGSKRGVNIKVAVILIIALCIGVYALFGDISYFMKGEGFVNQIQEAVMNINGNEVADKLLRQDASKLLIASLVPHIIVGLYYLSYRISCKLYLKGTEEYDV